MDRKSWIILVLCSIGLVLNYHFSSKNEQQLKEQTQEQVTTPVATDEPGLVTEKQSNPDTREDVPFQLVGKDGDKVDVIYTFTSFGGGVKTAEFPDQKSYDGKGHVKLNERSAYPVGALAQDYKRVSARYYEIVSGGEEGDDHVAYQTKLEDGLTVVKTWSLVKDDLAKGYQLKLDVTFKNGSKEAVNLAGWSVYSGTAAPLHAKELADRAGWFYYGDGEFEFDKQGPFTGGWFSDALSVKSIKAPGIQYAGVNNQFFTTFFLPQDFQPSEVWATGDEIEVPDADGPKKRWEFMMGLHFPDKLLAPGSEQSYGYKVYMGPKSRNIVAAVGEHTDKVMNYGWFSIFANFMSWAVNWIHDWFAGHSWAWGVAIILLTVTIRIVIWPLHNKSTRTMKRMSKLQPLMKEIREKHADNPQKMNQETMKLYKEYGVNPMGGCLPMLIQIPIFFGVFKMLGSAVEMRGASFLWVDDLSLPDTLGHVFGLPINVLPILMAVTMVVQMRMSPQTGDKLQRRIMMLMPLMFFFFCYNYASALALYWTVQNIVSIGQTWLTQRLPEPELKQKGRGGNDDGTPRKKGIFEKMAEKLEAVQAQQEAARGNVSGPRPVKGQVVEKPKKRDPRTGG